MKYFIDTEFIEGTQKRRFGRDTKPTIDLISIGIVSEDNMEYYAISKDFNLKEAWDRYETYPTEFKRYHWLREKVLYPIWNELIALEVHDGVKIPYKSSFTYKELKRLINKYGKTNNEIAEEVYSFCSNDFHKGNNLPYKERITYDLYDNFKPEFYGYYADYDWVVFCWLFGKMNDLPKGFPKYCIDLKQNIDNYVTVKRNKTIDETPHINVANWDVYLKGFKRDPNYPKQTNEHHALADAKWNKDLYNFLNTL